MRDIHSRWLVRWPIIAWEGLFRVWLQVDPRVRHVEPVMFLQVSRATRDLALADGTRIRRGDQIGTIHLDNRRVLALSSRRGRDAAEQIRAAGFRSRHAFLRSLAGLAAHAQDGGSLASLCAYQATSIHSSRLSRVGFVPAAGDRVTAASLVTAYQRALRSVLIEVAEVSTRSRVMPARRLWISRESLLALHGARATTNGTVPARALGAGAQQQ